MASPANAIERNDRIEGAPTPTQKVRMSHKAFDWLFGYDYFIAHRSVDGKEYASALYDVLTAKGSAFTLKQPAAQQFLSELRTRIFTQPLLHWYCVEARTITSTCEVFGPARDAINYTKGLADMMRVKHLTLEKI
jgi:hypothetical protein